MSEAVTALDQLIKRVNARIPTSVTPATRIEIHPAEWIELANAVEDWKQQAFRPLGDNHHNAKLCPHLLTCRDVVCRFRRSGQLPRERRARLLPAKPSVY